MPIARKRLLCIPLVQLPSFRDLRRMTVIFVYGLGNRFTRFNFPDDLELQLPREHPSFQSHILYPSDHLNILRIVRQNLGKIATSAYHYKD